MQIDKLIEKFYLGTLSKEEISCLLNDLKDEEPQTEISDLYQNTWDNAEDSNSEVDSEGLYNQLVSKLGVSVRLEPPPGSLKEKSAISMVSSLLRYAAVFAFAIGLSWLVHSYFLNTTKPSLSPVAFADQVQTIEVPYGSKSRVFLPDGSTVVLNSGSSLKYSSSGFNSGSRSVLLTGEGFFMVTKDQTRPFYVSTPGMKIKVLGTTFNVKAYLDENVEETTLVSGKVEIYASSDVTEKGKFIVLKPNQRAFFQKSDQNSMSVYKDSLMVRPVNMPSTLQAVKLQSSTKTEQTISWKENKLIFDNEAFSTWMIRMERWYNVKIVTDNTKLNTIRFTGKFDKETLEQVLNAIKTITPINYTIKHDVVTITEK